MNEWTSANRGAGTGRGQANDSHTQIVGTHFSCQPVTPNSNDWTDFGPPKFDAKPIGPSLDHIMAKQLSPEGVPLFMNTAGQSQERAQSAISYSAAETIFPALTATQAYGDLTGLFKAEAADERGHLGDCQGQDAHGYREGRPEQAPREEHEPGRQDEAPGLDGRSPIEVTTMVASPPHATKSRP